MNYKSFCGFVFKLYLGTYLKYLNTKFPFTSHIQEAMQMHFHPQGRKCDKS